MIAGKDMMRDQYQARRHIGYCPQYDPLLPKLTAIEHLKFYAMVKNMPKERIDPAIKRILKYLLLDRIADRKADSLNVGDRRKLSVAISLIGDPEIVFLDEPSAGMDPLSRRFMWKFIHDTMAGRSVILTTHIMEECEALCDRVGIMVEGRLRCLGTANHIKAKFGSGYVVELSTDEIRFNAWLKKVQTTFEEAQVLEIHADEGLVKMRFPLSYGSLADVFEYDSF
jgi:ABC-type multidrug transport system ATPase subunit